MAGPGPAIHETQARSHGCSWMPGPRPGMNGLGMARFLSRGIDVLAAPFLAAERVPGM
jgi:hypothetical protein